MKTILGLVITAMLMIVTLPAYSDGVAMQIWKCEIDEEATEQDVKDMASKWLQAAKSMKGGKNIEAAVAFPVAVNNMADTDLLISITAPTFAEWGMFWDSYGNSAAAAVDKADDKVDCPNSGLWERFIIK